MRLFDRNRKGFSLFEIIATIVLALFLLLLMPVLGFSQTTVPPPPSAPAPVTPAPAAPTAATPDLTTIFGSFNIGTDLVYLPRAKAWEAGGHIDLISYKNIVCMRVEAGQGAVGSPFFGGGLAVNLVPLCNLLGTNIEMSGIMKVLNPAIAITPGYNSTLGAKHFDYGVVLSVVGYTW